MIGIPLVVLMWGCSSSGTSVGLTPGVDAGDSEVAGSPSDGSVNDALDAPPPSPWVELAQPGLSVQGGAAPFAGGIGHDAGKMHFVTTGALSLDPTLPAPAAPAAPVVGALGAQVSTLPADGLGADLAVGNGLSIDGRVTTGGADAVRSIRITSGDLYVMGTLRSTVVGGARQAIAIDASAGIVYVVGSIDTSGAAGTGEAGGAISITARQVVVIGKLTSGGGDGVGAAGAAGAAGAISILATETIAVSGSIDAMGGDALGAGPVSGGHGGDIALRAGGDLALTGAIRLRGGAATATVGDAQGGDAATLRVDAGGVVQFGGKLDGRGGIARSPGAGRSLGGAGGAVETGGAAPPASMAVLVPLDLTGGSGEAAAGKGGTATLSPKDGAISIAGARAIDASGGSSSIAPGAGGTISCSPTNWGATGTVHLTGEIIADGGSIYAGSSGNGGDAGLVSLQMLAQMAPVLIDVTGKISVTGGASGGSGVAGGGGHVFVWTDSGDLTMAGTVVARGGNAPDPGGTGGRGGFCYFFSDGDHDAKITKLGNLLIATTGVVDASGGDGSIGGSARSDGAQWSVPNFPDNQESISIFLNCDGVHGDTLNWLSNQGHLIAHGGASGGNGGDIVYHGIAPDRNPKPPSGNIDIAGNGTGKPGDWLGE